MKMKPAYDDKDCHCDHKLTGTGAVFYQSTGWLYCTVCNGWQLIRKPLFPTNGDASVVRPGYDLGSTDEGEGKWLS